MRYVLLLLLLTSCAAREGFIEPTGRYLGERQMENISPKDISLRLPTEPAVVSAERQSLPDRILEDIDLGVGIIRHETVTSRSGLPDQRSVREFRHLFDGWYLGGITVKHSELDPTYDHPLTYATFPLEGRECTAFLRPLGSTIEGGRHEQAVQGIFCGWSKERILEWVMGIQD